MVNRAFSWLSDSYKENSTMNNSVLSGRMMIFIKRHLLSILFLLVSLATYGQKQYTLVSPDGKVELELTISDSIYYEVMVNKNQLIQPSAVSLSTNFTEKRWNVGRTKRNKVDQVLSPVVWQKNASIRDEYHELQIDFRNDLSLQWRAYNNGVAWRWIVDKKGAVKIMDETAHFNFQKHDRAWYPLEDGFFSHNERHYHEMRLDSVGPKDLASLPALFQVEEAGMKVLITESDLRNYAGMWLRGGGEGKIRAVFTLYTKKKLVKGDRN